MSRAITTVSKIILAVSFLVLPRATALADSPIGGYSFKSLSAVTYTGSNRPADQLGGSTGMGINGVRQNGQQFGVNLLIPADQPALLDRCFKLALVAQTTGAAFSVQTSQNQVFACQLGE